MMDKPFPQSYWVREELLCAGQYPGDLDPAKRDDKLRGLLRCGIRRVINLMEITEQSNFEPYVSRLREFAAGLDVAVECLNHSIPDASSPTPELMRQILKTIDESLQARMPAYVHCWGGHGRTSTVIACHLIQQGSSPRQAIETLLRWRAGLPKKHYPFEGPQEGFVLAWSGYVEGGGPA